MKSLAGILILLTLANPLFAQQAEVSTQQELLAERDKIIAEIKQLSAQVAALEKEYDEKILFAILPPARKKVIQSDKLKSIRLPLAPDRGAVREYVASIVRLSRDQRSFAVFDPQA